MTDEAKKLLYDLRTACEAIQTFAAGRAFFSPAFGFTDDSEVLRWRG